MVSRSIVVRVPATVGNFGGAGECAALALDAALNAKVTERHDSHAGVRYFGENGERVPRDESNLVVQALKTALEFKGLQFNGANFEIYSSIPVGVGLGSSTAAVLAGLIAADRLYQLRLSEKDLLELTRAVEKRSENIEAAWSGGFVACAPEGPRCNFRRISTPETFVLSVLVPELKTVRLLEKESGSQSSQHDHDLRSRRAAVLAEFISSPGDVGSHELGPTLSPAHDKAVPGLDEALKVQAAGLLATFVCGSGPAVGILAEGDATEAIGAIRECFVRQGMVTRTMRFHPSNAGARELNRLQSFPGFHPSHATLSGSFLNSVEIPV